MNILITYATRPFYRAQRLNAKTGIAIGEFDRVFQYRPKDIEHEFFAQHQHILSYERGAGYWLWKPYVIQKALTRLQWGDYLFYSDAGSRFVNSIAPVIKVAEETRQEIVVFELHGSIEKNWTKRDAFLLMECDAPEYAETPQRMGGLSLWKKSSYTLDVVHDYLTYARDARILTDQDNQMGLPNYPGFIAHRHDQSVLSLLSKRLGVPAYREPSQCGNGCEEHYPQSLYPQCVQLDRKRSFEFRLYYKMREIYASLKQKNSFN